MTQEEQNRKKFSNWLQSVQSLDDTKKALHDHVLDLWKTTLMSWTRDNRTAIPVFLSCVAKSKVEYKNKWVCKCEHRHCGDILKLLINLQQNPGPGVVWNSNLCENIASDILSISEGEKHEDNIETIPRIGISLVQFLQRLFKPFQYLPGVPEIPDHSINYKDIFEKCKKEHVWCIANMFMQRGKAKSNITNTGPDDTDAAMFFRMMWNCKLFKIENENNLYEDVLLCRDRLHHSANNRIPRAEAQSYLNTMTDFLKKFKNVPKCKDVISKIEKVQQETILCISVPDTDIRKMASRVFNLKIRALEADIETNKEKGICNDETHELLEEAATEFKNTEDTGKPFNDTKSREEYKRENRENLKRIDEIQEKVTQLEVENRILQIQGNEADRNKDTDISEKVKDPEKHFDIMTSLVKTFTHNPGIAEAISKHINPVLDAAVKAASKSDETLREKIEEVYEQENSEQQTTNDMNQRQDHDSNKTDDQDQNIYENGADLNGGNADSLRLRQPSATTEVEQKPGIHRPHLWSVASRKSYNIKVEEDRYCRILGCCQLPTGELIMVDNNNYILKKLDARYQVASVYVLTYKSKDVCYIGNNEVVVSSFSNELQFVDVVSMTLTRSVKTVHKCYGLACHGTNLYFLAADSVYVYRVDGTEQRILYTLPEDISISSWMGSIAVNDEGSKIYISTSGYLFTIDSSGNHLFTLADQDLNLVSGVCVDGKGYVLVCNIYPGSILQVSHDGKHMLGTIVNISDEYPVAIFFDRHNSILICAGYSDNVTVLQLK